MAVMTNRKRKILRKSISSGGKPTFEKVWAMMKENAEQMKETDKKMQETDRIIKENAEQMKETEKRLKETDRITRRNGKQMGEIHRRFGQLAEHLVAPGIAKRFNEMGYHFSEVAQGGLKIFDEQGKIKTEIDLLLLNSSAIMAVEVKTKPVSQDVEHHIKRLEILRDHKRSLNDLRKIHGAVAGAIYDNDVKKTVREAGMYVIEQSGDTMKIDMPDGFIPREW